MNKKSAGIILYRFSDKVLEVLLVHPGGPFWAKKDKGVWSIPKGEFNDKENALEAAKREFEEELGSPVLSADLIELAPVKSKNNKTVYCFAAEEDFNTNNVKSNLCSIEWPPRTGMRIEIPEVDRAEWFDIKAAKEKILLYQLPLIEELNSKLKSKK
jgi:predicted NUDIX family NTP pyrophosphohydrolase